MKRNTLEYEDIKILADIYTAIGGMCSEIEDPFGHFYRGGTEKMDMDFMSVLKKLGVEEA